MAPARGRRRRPGRHWFCSVYLATVDLPFPAIENCTHWLLPSRVRHSRHSNPVGQATSVLEHVPSLHLSQVLQAVVFRPCLGRSTCRSKRPTSRPSSGGVRWSATAASTGPRTRRWMRLRAAEEQRPESVRRSPAPRRSEAKSRWLDSTTGGGGRRWRVGSDRAPGRWAGAAIRRRGQGVAGGGSNCAD